METSNYSYKQKSQKPLWREWGESIAIAILMTVIIMTFIARSYMVDGISMEHTLYDRERVLVDKISYRFSEPSRGEIIVLRTPGGDFIKRVIAIGGDTIEEADGVIFLNGEPISEPYIINKTGDNWGPYKVPSDHYWVMGYNRPRSDDSRMSVGYLPRRDIIGRAVLRYWPPRELGILK